MVGKLKSDIKGQLDPYQFAYKDNRGTDDALLTITHFILPMLDCLWTSALPLTRWSHTSFSVNLGRCL